MTQTAANPYLRTKVMTASPEQLRLMLYDGAIRFCRQARHALGRRDFEASYNSLVRAQKIVLELSTSLNHDADADLCGKLAALYDYIYRRLVDANMTREPEPIDESVRLLEYQRETWVLLMKKLNKSFDDSTGSSPATEPPPPNPIASIRPTHGIAGGAGNVTATGGFSAEG